MCVQLQTGFTPISFSRLSHTMEVSWNRAPPKSSIYRWIFHEINHAFWGDSHPYLYPLRIPKDLLGVTASTPPQLQESSPKRSQRQPKAPEQLPRPLDLSATKGSGELFAAKDWFLEICHSVNHPHKMDRWMFSCFFPHMMSVSRISPSQRSI